MPIHELRESCICLDCIRLEYQQDEPLRHRNDFWKHQYPQQYDLIFSLETIWFVIISSDSRQCLMLQKCNQLFDQIIASKTEII